MSICHGFDCTKHSGEENKHSPDAENQGPQWGLLLFREVSVVPSKIFKSPSSPIPTKRSYEYAHYFVVFKLARVKN
jgi:hypothetical protein